MRNSRQSKRVLRNLVSPFDGEPRTKLRVDRSGQPVITVSPNILTPQGAKFADGLGNATSFAAVLTGVGFLASQPVVPPIAWVIAVALPPMLSGLFRTFWRSFVHKRVNLTFTPEFVTAPGKWGSKRSYDRSIPHTFILRGHDKAQEEEERAQEKELRARMRGSVKRGKKYFRDTCVIEFSDGYQAYPLLEVMGGPEGRQIFQRIKAVDAEIDKPINANGLPLTGPETEWDEMTGQIPEEL